MRGGGNESFFSPPLFFKNFKFCVCVCAYAQRVPYKPAVKPHYLCMMNPFIFSLTLLTYVHVHIHPKCQHSFRFIFEFQITRPLISLPLFFCFPEASRISISPPVCVRACGGLVGVHQVFHFPLTLSWKKKIPFFTEKYKYKKKKKKKKNIFL